MSQAVHSPTWSSSSTTVMAGSPAFQAYRTLQIAFVVAPVVAGFDKFFHFLVNWDMYLAPVVNQMLADDRHERMPGASEHMIHDGRGDNVADPRRALSAAPGTV